MTEEIQEGMFPEELEVVPKTAAEVLESCTNRVRDTTKEPPTVEKMRISLLAVEYKDRLKQLKNYNQLGTLLHALATNGQVHLLRCVIACIKTPDERYSVGRLVDDCGSTLLHCAAGSRHPQIISIFVSSLIKNDRLRLLSMRDSAGFTPLDCSVRNETLYEDVAGSIMQHLSPEQQKELIEKSASYLKASSKLDEERSASAAAAANTDINVGEQDEARQDDVNIVEPEQREEVHRQSEGEQSELLKLLRELLQNSATEKEERRRLQAKFDIEMAERIKLQAELEATKKKIEEVDDHVWQCERLKKGKPVTNNSPVTVAAGSDSDVETAEQPQDSPDSMDNGVI